MYLGVDLTCPVSTTACVTLPWLPIPLLCVIIGRHRSWAALRRDCSISQGIVFSPITCYISLQKRVYQKWVSAHFFVSAREGKLKGGQGYEK